MGLFLHQEEYFNILVEKFVFEIKDDGIKYLS